MEKRGLDQYNRLIVDTDYALEILYADKDLSNVSVEDCDEIERFRKYGENVMGEASIDPIKDSETNPDEYNEIRYKWMIPDQEYEDIDLKQFLLSKCNADKEIERVKSELRIYEKHDLLNMLKLIIYLVDLMRKNDIVWGVGRGSSVASYCLYLIGLHKVDSIEYDLNFGEFLR